MKSPAVEKSIKRTSKSLKLKRQKRIDLRKRQREYFFIGVLCVVAGLGSGLYSFFGDYQSKLVLLGLYLPFMVGAALMVFNFSAVNNRIGSH
ncbi:MAG: hypothetical protein ACI9YL_001224 [Luteibaculaceae bacterium]|jgi:hypothetical protein